MGGTLVWLHHPDSNSWVDPCERNSSVKILPEVALGVQKDQKLQRASEQEVLTDSQRTRGKKNESNSHLQVPREKRKKKSPYAIQLMSGKQTAQAPLTVYWDPSMTPSPIKWHRNMKQGKEKWRRAIWSWAEPWGKESTISSLCSLIDNIVSAG